MGLECCFDVLTNILNSGTIKTIFCLEQSLNPNEDAKLTAFEKAGMENYLHRQHTIGRDQIDVKIATTGER